MLFASWEVRIVKNCDLGLENAALGCPRSQFFTIRTEPRPLNNLFIFFQTLKQKKQKNSRKFYCDCDQR